MKSALCVIFSWLNLSAVPEINVFDYLNSGRFPLIFLKLVIHMVRTGLAKLQVYDAARAIWTTATIRSVYYAIDLI